MGEGEQVISVSELDRRLRRVLEGATGREWVEGEVTSLKRVASGHVYFCLRDEREEAVIDCVMYRFKAQRALRYLSDGARVQLWGKATLWAPRGRLQLVAERARPAGRGALLEALEQLKQKLLAEGLFAPEKKRPLPKEPRVVGVVTSAHGAAFHDVRSVAFRRGGARIVLSPALVQGEGAPLSIVRAIDLIERYPGLDVLIVGRGGGAAEDLMAFNDERVVRRVAATRVPVVSAVGHEIDITLTDLCADLRAATPSQAAELVIPDVATRAEALQRHTLELARAMHGRLRDDAHVLEQLRGKLSDPRFLIAERQQYLDDAASRLERKMGRVLRERRALVERQERRLLGRHPRAVVAGARAQLGPLQANLGSAMRMQLAGARGVLGDRAARLDGLSPLAVLGRGYAIATRDDGRAVRSAADVAPGDTLDVRVHRGRLQTRVQAVHEDEPTTATGEVES